MQISALLLFIGVISISAKTFSQETKVSIKVKNKTVNEVFSQIKEQTSYSFWFDAKDVDINRKVSVNVKGETVKNVLQSILQGQGLDFTVKGNHIIIARKQEMASVSAPQQNRKISGIVKDPTGEPIIEANIIVKGTQLGNMTDTDGHFALEVPAQSILQVSYIGFLAQEIKVGNESNFTITLIEDTQSLEEVVVVGYGVQKKKLTTGATVQVKGDDLQKLSTVSPLSAMQSQSPGVTIVQNSGKPGSDYKVNIRGIGTVGNSDPLYIIDGFVGGDINLINPSDIESIDVLKDAASAAIYGSRAANGVILVTTKRGKAGKASITYDGYVGFQNISKKLDQLNAQQYVSLQNEAHANTGVSAPDFGSLVPTWNDVQNGWTGTNWLDEAENKNALIQNHSLNIVGGTDQSIYSLGISDTEQEGIIGQPIIPKYTRYSLRVNTEHTIIKNKSHDILKFGETLLYTHKKETGDFGIGDMYNNSLRTILAAGPLMPLMNANGEYHEALNYDMTTANPIGSYYYNNAQTVKKTNTLIGSVYAEIQPIKDLIFKTNFGFSYNTLSSRGYYPAYYLSNTLLREEASVSQQQHQNMGFQWETRCLTNLRSKKIITSAYW